MSLILLNSGVTPTSYVYLVEWMCLGCRCTKCPNPNGEGKRLLRWKQVTYYCFYICTKLYAIFDFTFSVKTITILLLVLLFLCTILYTIFNVIYSSRNPSNYFKLLWKLLVLYFSNQLKLTLTIQTPSLSLSCRPTNT